MTEDSITAEELKIARHRLENMPAHLEVSLGSRGTFDREELREHLEAEDSIGKEYARMEMAGLRAFKDL